MPFKSHPLLCVCVCVYNIFNFIVSLDKDSPCYCVWVDSEVT